MRFERVWVDCKYWEELLHNFWGNSVSLKKDKLIAVNFMRDHKRFGQSMIKVVDEWKFSCINALTDYSINRIAWIGQAAVSRSLSIPEYVTRAAWKELSLYEQELANQQARIALRKWEQSYAKSIGLHLDVGESLL